MKALVFDEKNRPLALVDREAPVAGAGEVAIELKAAALNRRDFWITRGLYPGLRSGVILGSDGAGVVREVGAGVDSIEVGDEVVVDPSLDWGGDERVQGGDYRILGMPDDGTFAERVVVSADNVHAKPSHLGWDEAAALPLAGLTAYRAMFSRGGLEPGDRVLVTGAGGGVATFLVQFAKAAGAEVLVTSSSAEKIAAAVELGATAGFDYRDGAWGKALVAAHGAPNLIVDGAGGDGYSTLLAIAAPGARIVNYGSTAGAPAALDLFKVFWKQLDLRGSTMGSPRDFRDMLGLVARERIVPVVDQSFGLSRGNDAIARLGESAQFGKVVLRLGA